MSITRYQAYKPSGVEWLGEVPEHWQQSRLGLVAWVRARLGWKGLKAEEYVDDGFAFLSTPNIKNRDIDFRDVNFINRDRYDESPEIKLVEGDVLLAKDGSTLGIANVVRILPRPATVNSSIAVLTPTSQLNSLYLYYLLSGSGMQQLIQQKKGGMGVPHLFQADLVKFEIPLPALVEQAYIAAFLDQETAKIDALIAEQQRLIELLQEKRQAVISHAVTKGLNPDAPMKDSGVEWLGEVPEHWEVMGLTKTIGPVVDYRGRTPTKCDSGTLLVTAKNIRNGGIDYALSEEYVEPVEAEQLLQRGKPAQGDVLFTMEAPLGQVALVDREDIALAQRVVKFRGIGDRMTNEFLMWWLIGSHSQYQLNSLSTGSTALGIKSSKLSAVICVVPPLQEQTAISNRIRDLRDQLASVHSAAISQIDLLQERRSALISAAVTGQIDVRGLAEAKAGEQ